MSNLSYNLMGKRSLPRGPATMGGKRRAGTTFAVLSVAIYLTTSEAVSHRSFSTHYRPQQGENRLSGTTLSAATTTFTWRGNPVPPLWEGAIEEPLPSTPSPAPADTLHSPFQDAYLPVTPSITISSPPTQGKAFVSPHRRRYTHRNPQLLPRRSHSSPRDSWRQDNEGGGFLKWPLQVLRDDHTPQHDGGVEDDDKTLRWWVTNEPQLTLAAPETTRRTQRPPYFQKPPRTTRILNWGSQDEEPPPRSHLNTHQVGGSSQGPPSSPPPPPRTMPPAASPTIRPPPLSPTTMAEDPAVLQAPHDLITYNEVRQPRWFPLDRLFRMITVGADGECTGREGRMGVCMLEGACRNSGGTPSTSCVFGYGNCCIEYKATCGLEVRTNRTYWVSPLPQKDSIVSKGGSCILRIFKTSPNICHIRLDMKRFTLIGPRDGSCLRDRLVVSGHNINAFIPKICGENAGQHMYIDVDTVPGPIELHINTVGEGLTRSWEIEVSQIACNSPHRPPANCLQYYTGASGSFSSFNYLPNANSQYLNNLNYAICLRKEAGFCSVVYNNEVNSNKQDFELVNFRITQSGLATTVVPIGEAGVGLIQCPDDYLVMAGTRLCGYRLNDGSNIPQSTNSGPVTDSTNGPFTVQFTTNTENTGLGFQLHYQQYPC